MTTLVIHSFADRDMFVRFADIGIGHEIQYCLPRGDGSQVLDDDEPEAITSSTFDIDSTTDQDEGSDDEDCNDDDDDMNDMFDDEDCVSEDQEDSEDEGQDFKF